MRNIQLNSIANCTVIHAIASGKSGTARFEAFGNGHVITEDSSTVWPPEVVQAYSIDDLAAAYRYPDMVYVDVEGSECEVLERATQTFQRKPDWFVEVHQGAGLEDRGGSVDRVLSYFATNATSQRRPLRTTTSSGMDLSYWKNRIFLPAVSTLWQCRNQNDGMALPIACAVGVNEGCAPNLRLIT